jgi:hypothetical protein
MVGANKNAVDLVDSVRLILRTPVGQRLRFFRLVFWKTVLKDVRELLRKGLLIIFEFKIFIFFSRSVANLPVRVFG